jgi:septal ring factor EnvC (AmiA/AmiB activator)
VPKVRRQLRTRVPGRWRQLLVTLLLLILPGLGLAQSDEEKTRDQLQQLEREIKRINWEISSASNKRSKLQEQLRTAEIELGKLRRNVADNQREVASGKAELTVLEQRRNSLEEDRSQQQARIALELKSAWQMGREGQLKVLLKQESPDTVARTMAYYRYFFRARNTLLEQYRKTMLELQALGERIDNTLIQLDKRRRALTIQRSKLARAQANREKAVAALSASIEDKGTQLKQKEGNRKKLESLLSAIEEAVGKLELPSNYQPIKNARGKMPWPLGGKPSNSFGRSRNEGKMRWQGITIPAREGATVKAIHHGRVVYADWLRGSGLLLIIDHGDGYMSLYAHNQSLLKDVGEWVTADTPISTAGSTGGQDSTALYFEIRHNGKPTDPAKWCQR